MEAVDNVDRDIIQILSTSGIVPHFGCKHIPREIDEIRVSLFGNSKIHNQISRVDSFKRVSNFIGTKLLYYPVQLTTPIFNKNQVISAAQQATNFGLELRTTALLPHGRAKDIRVLPIARQSQILREICGQFPCIKETCSLCEGVCHNPNGEKYTLLPNGVIIGCVAEKHTGLRGLYSKACRNSPYWKKVKNQIYDNPTNTD